MPTDKQEHEPLLAVTYGFQNNEHFAFQRKGLGVSPWTLLIGEDEALPYKSICKKWVEENLIGCALSVDLRDEPAMVNLLSLGKAQLGEWGEITISNPELVIVVLDIRDDVGGDQWKGLSLGERLRPLAGDRVLNATRLSREEVTLSSTHGLETESFGILHVEKRTSEAAGAVCLTEESAGKIRRTLEQVKRRWEANSVIIKDAQSIRIAYRSPIGQFEDTGWQKANQPELMLHWLLSHNGQSVPLERLAIYSGWMKERKFLPTKDANGGRSKQRSSQRDLYREWREYVENRPQRTGQRGVKQSSGGKKPTVISDEEQHRIEERIAAYRKSQGEAKEKATRLEEELAGLQALRLYLSADASGSSSALKLQAQTLAREIATANRDLAYLASRRTKPATKAANLAQRYSLHRLLAYELCVLGNTDDGEFPRCLIAFLNSFVSFCGSPNAAEKLLANYECQPNRGIDEIDEVSVRGDAAHDYAESTCEKLTQKIDGKREERDVARREALGYEVEIQHAAGTKPVHFHSKKNPLYEPIAKALTKDLIRSLRKWGCPELADALKARIKVGNGDVIVTGIQFRVSPATGPVLSQSKELTGLDLPFLADLQNSKL